MITRKWRNRLVPSILVGVTIGFGGQWARSCQVVSLSSILSEARAARLSIWTVADVTFPEVVSFPFKQRVMLHGAFEDAALPAPHVSNDTKKLEVVAEEGADVLLEYDGLLNENARRFKKTRTIEIIMAIDPDTAPEEVESPEDEQIAFEEPGGAPDWYLDILEPLEPDVAEAASACAQPTPVEAAELITRGRAPPA